MKAGKMQCNNGETLSVLEIVNECMAKAKNKPVRFDFSLDCCGSSGQYYQIKDAYEKNQITNAHLIEWVRIVSPCAYDEVSFGGANGGLWINDDLVGYANMYFHESSHNYKFKLWLPKNRHAYFDKKQRKSGYAVNYKIANAYTAEMNTKYPNMEWKYY